MSRNIEVGVYRTQVQTRHARGARMRAFYLSSILVAFLALIALGLNIINGAFGLIQVDFEVRPDELVIEQMAADLVADSAHIVDVRFSDLSDADRDAAILRIAAETAYNTTQISFFLSDLPDLMQLSSDDVQALLTDVPDLITFTPDQLAGIMLKREPGQLVNTIHQYLTNYAEARDMAGVPLKDALIPGTVIPDGLADVAINEGAGRDNAMRAQLLALNLTSEQLVEIINNTIVKTDVLRSWTLDESLFNRSEINHVVRDDEENPNAELQWRSWLSLDFLTSPISSTTPAITGIRPALLGTIWLLLLTAAIGFPIGVGAAVYLEEYANNAWYNKLIEINIRNLAGVPSIIYGMLGLAVFVRALEGFTSGSMFGDGSANGRTVISGALTLALLILPIIIAGTQEALRAVPSSIREASYGLGATKWQTISRQVLPYALPGILTSTIIGLSRAIGETAPLIVVGAATFITDDPSSPFSQFSALPRLIYHWTSQPDPQFRNAAAAAIVVLIILLLTMNSFAIVLRNRASRR